MLQFDGQLWAPSTYTAPLRGELVLSDGPRLVELLEGHWRLPGKGLVKLDDWQKCGFNHILERYPLDWPIERLRGRLRFRQVVASLGRQNGKSLIGGGLALYGLTQHVVDPSVVGVATSVDQANVVYQRVRSAILRDPLLSSLMTASGTRGVKWRDDRGGYLVKPALREGLQSVPVSAGIADELHLMLRELWYSIVNGQRAQSDALLAGITTAGDDGSDLLKELYQRGHAAAADPDLDQRFGFFLWEAPEGSTIYTPGAIEAANPAVACGRIQLAEVVSDVAKSPVTDQERYTLNRFVAASRAWANLEAFRLGATTDPLPDEGRVIFGVDRSAGWEWVSITAAVKVNGKVHTETVASLRGIDRDGLLALLGLLLDDQPDAAVAMDSRRLSDVGKNLRDQGREVWLLTSTEMAQASAGVYARLLAGVDGQGTLTGPGTLTHDGHPILGRQLATSHQKRMSDGAWLIAAGKTPADAIVSLFVAAHVADVAPPPAGSQLH